ncbi:MAG: diaminopimelate epimerase [Actinomycetota bacterium]|nr:diaminopimelate epimerase [Actinomycetota bacterium]
MNSDSNWLYKYQGIGNDFLVAEVEDVPKLEFNEGAKRLCDRNYGVGADGLIMLTLSGTPTMHLYNSDGSRAAISGNGLRCLGFHIRRMHLVREREFDVTTDAGVRGVIIHAINGDTARISSSMGEVQVSPTADFKSKIGGQNWAAYLANVGNPHLVFLAEQPLQNLESFRDAIAEEALQFQIDYPGGVNVEWVVPKEAATLTAGEVEMIVFERGAGFTLACGSGSTAVGAVLRSLRGGQELASATIKNPGGELSVSYNGQRGEFYLEGPASFVAKVAPSESLWPL